MKKTNIVSVDPPPLMVSVLWLLLVYFWPYIMIICVLKRILHKKKSIFMQLLESPIPPLTAAALRMIICKRLSPPNDHLQEAGLSGSSFARGRPLRMTICKRPVPPDNHLQGPGHYGWPLARGWSLRIIICKRPAPHFDNHDKGKKSAFLRPFTMR